MGDMGDILKDNICAVGSQMLMVAMDKTENPWLHGCVGITVTLKAAKNYLFGYFQHIFTDLSTIES